MKTIRILSIIIMISLLLPSISFGQKEKNRAEEKVNWRVDNNGYWKRMAEKGLTTLNPMTDVPKAEYTGSEMDALSSFTLDSPDIPVTTENCTQSENSIFINPNDPLNVLNSNNSTANPYPPLYGANDLYSFDGGLSWTGEIQGAGVDNTGDPAVVIGHNGWYYVNSITADGWHLGQQVSYSIDQGNTWSVVVIDDAASSQVLDKNHFWIDNNLNSPYEGNLYCAWTDFGGPHDMDIAFAYSSDEGISWNSAVNVSSGVSAGSHCQGVNINTGPNGEVYVVFAIYDAQSDENAYGFTKSPDGGASWEPATRIIENTRGIRSSETSKNQRVNSFPVLAVDNSNGPFSGNLYMVWTNIGVPGVNNGDDIDIYMIRSSDQGDSWSDPIRVNQDETGLGHEHYFPWITCDPGSGILSVIFYDDRNVGGNQCEVFCANSFDAGDSWEDFKVSDVAFTPTPIPDLAIGYMGDYLGITSKDTYVYPCWTDNRTGTTMTYVSPYVLNNLSRPFNLSAELDEENGSVDLNWEYEEATGFEYFIIYREGSEIAQATDTFYTDQLPDYGIYQYKVTAYYEVEGESFPAETAVQWGAPHIHITPYELEQSLAPNETAVKNLTIYNTGQLDLHYDISTFIISDKQDSKDYCSADGGCDEYIGQVQFGDINNTSDCGEYQDFTSLSTDISIGANIPITITNGNSWTGDVCGIWIDWNQNDDFTDEDPINVSGGPEVFTANISAPDNAIGGMTRMRIRIQYYGTPEPCGSSDYGEVEDYSLNVISWLTLGQSSGTILPGETDEIAVYFDATDMALGDYFAEFSVSSDDPDMAMVNIPVTMHVADFIVTALADPEEVCVGETVQLDVEVVGGGGSYAYTWTSEPPGFNSTLKAPQVAPVENTTYTVHAADGTNSGSGSIDVSVFDYPVVSIGPDMEICIGEEHIFSAGNGYASYEWQDGSDSTSFTATESGLYWVEVTNSSGCASRDSAVLVVKQLPTQPAKPAGPSMLDLYNGNTSVYLTSEQIGVNNYSWVLEPSSAGILQNNEAETTVEWSNDFTGTAILKVMTSNLCGNSIWSDKLEINITNTFGIHDLEKQIGVDIYPNPNNGSFSIKLSTESIMKVNIYISNSLSTIVYKSEDVQLRGKHNEQISLGQLSAGVYTIIIEGKAGRLSRQVIVHE